MREAAAQALLDGPNQYPPMRGLPALREAVAEHYRAHQGSMLDWKTEITITSGATEALAAAILAVIEPGDEIVLIEPMYDSYLPMVRRAGGVPRFIRLEPPDWRIGEAQLAAAFSAKTKAIILNTPHNPAASVMSDEELALIARLCRDHDAIAISDEVWEHVALRWRAPCLDADASARTHDQDRLGREDVLDDRLESRFRLRRAGANRALRQGAPIPHLHHAAEFAAAPSRSGSARSAPISTTCAPSFQRSRDRLAHGLAQEGFVALPARGAYFLSIDLRRIRHRARATKTSHCAR